MHSIISICLILSVINCFQIMKEPSKQTKNAWLYRYFRVKYLSSDVSCMLSKRADQEGTEQIYQKACPNGKEHTCVQHL